VVRFSYTLSYLLQKISKMICAYLFLVALFCSSPFDFFHVSCIAKKFHPYFLRISILLMVVLFLVEYSTTESDEFEKQDDCELTCEDEPTFFFDSVDHFVGSENGSSTMSSGQGVVDTQKQDSNKTLTQIKRRTELPEPTEKEKGISLWSIIKDSIGKDLTRVCLPVYFNEPLSSLQKCFEDLEYSYLLDQAYQYGKVVRSPHIFFIVYLAWTFICFMMRHINSYYHQSLLLFITKLRLKSTANLICKCSPYNKLKLIYCEHILLQFGTNVVLDFTAFMWSNISC
jgi:hypothetical protein